MVPPAVQAIIEGRYSDAGSADNANGNSSNYLVVRVGAEEENFTLVGSVMQLV
jgi:hypothetical protein